MLILKDQKDMRIIIFGGSWYYTTSGSCALFWDFPPFSSSADLFARGHSRHLDPSFCLPPSKSPNLKSSFEEI